MELPRDLAADVQGAWHRFIERTEPLRPSLHRYCRSLTGSVWDAEELVQDTLLRAFAKLGEIHQEIASPKAYLLRIASNLWIDRMRRRPEAPAAEPIPTVEEPGANGPSQAGSRPAGEPAIPSSSSTPKEFRAMAMRLYWPTVNPRSKSCWVE